MSRTSQIFSVARARSLRVQAVDQLRKSIVVGALPPGSMHSEQSIAAQMSISRTPVREALLQLAAENLVEYLPQRGLRILPFDPDRLAQGLQLRAAIEGYCARALAEDPRPDVLAGLDDELRRQREIVAADDRLGWVEANMDFHILLVRSLRNALMTETIVGLASHTMRIGYRMNERRERMSESVAEHTAVVDAIRAGDSERAQALASEHLYVTEALMRKLFEELGLELMPMER